MVHGHFSSIGLKTLISNPDKFDEVDPDLMVTTPMSTYYSAETVTTSLV